MTQKSEIFETNYNEYLARISETNFTSVKDNLGTVVNDGQVHILFFNRNYTISKDGIMNDTGKRPDYATCIILSKYILLCPDMPHSNIEWTAFRDFNKISNFTNTNYFASDTEKPIAQKFSGQPDVLAKACIKSDGFSCEEKFSYDLVMQFNALPKISLLLLFNDKDEDFPAECSVLFQKQAEDYLDPESLAMTSALLTKKLIDSVDL